MKRLLAAIAGLVIALVGTVAVAAWLSSGAGAATVGATTVLKAYTPQAVPGNGEVTLSWDASTLGNGLPVGGYHVVRHQGTSSTVVCSTTTQTTCADPSPLPAQVQYGVVAFIGGWTGPESDRTSFQYDGQAPVTSIVVNPEATSEGWNNTAVDVFLTAADTSGIDRMVFTIDGTESVAPMDNTWFTVSGTGSHTITWYAVDEVGNVETTHTRVIRIDPDAPVTSVSPSPGANGAGWNNSDVTLGFTAADVSGAGVRSITVDGVTTTDATATKTVSAEGTTSVNYFAIDKADNVEATKTATVKIDRTRPSATISPVSDDSAWRRTTTASLSGTDALSGVASVSYKLNGAASFTTVNASTATISGLVQGANTIVYKATDKAGNDSVDQTATINVDTVAPTSSIVKTTSNTWTISASDDSPSSGGLSIEWWIDSGAHTPVSASSTLVTVPDGNHTIHWFARDAAGNQETPTHDLSVTSTTPDTTAPISSITKTSSNTWTISASDPSPSSGGLSIEWWVDSGAHTPVSASSTVVTVTPGNHTIHWFAKDAAGNQEATHNLDVMVVAPPKITSCTGANGSNPFNLKWQWLGTGDPNGGFKLYYTNLTSGSLTPSTFGPTARLGSTPNINSLNGRFELVAIVDGVESAPATADFVAQGSKTCTIN